MKTSLHSTSSWKRQVVVMLGIAALLTLGGQSLVYAQISASDMAAMKQEIAKQKYTFTVGENPATKIPLSDLCGTIPSLAPKSANSLSSKTMVAETSLPSYWDWRQHNGVTPVKDQGYCGSCWAFSTVGTMEAAILIASGITTDLSEQQLVSCNPYGWGCIGGNYAFDMEISPGAMLESCFPYQAADVTCQSGCPHVYKLNSWGYVGDSSSVPSTTAIKNAIYTCGPISVCVAVDGYFQAYSGGVFNHNSSSSIDHAVVLVGWDDTNGCWIMKNSWGTGWGESGYMRIAYGCDQIGYAAAYALWVLPEPLVITPATGFNSIGGVGGPFTITSQSLSLTNAGTNSLTWTLVNTSLWLNASPSGGTLTHGGPATTVTVSLNTAASNLVVGTYSATLWFTNLSSGVGQSRQFTLAVISPPTITAQPLDQAVLEGAMATFTVAATGGLPLFYQWQDNGTNLTDGGNISGSTTTNLVISNVSPVDVGTYSVIVTNVAGVATSSNALLTITPSPPVITLQPADQTAVVGETAAFTVAAIGTTPFSYQWSFDGTNLVGMTDATLTLTNVQLSQAGSYAVVITNIYGSATSSNATLNVYTVPVIISFDPPSGAAGTVVNISGLNFDPTPSNNIVYFGAVQAAVTAASVTNLVVTVPVGAAYAPITETVNGLTAYANAPFMPTFSGDGSGITVNSFVPRLNLAAGSGPIKVVIADLDGDGKPDLIVANDYGNTISLYRNISTNGSLTAGSFAPRVDLVTPPGNSSPFGLVVADVDGDGKLDIIVSDYNENIVSVYRNTCTPGNISTSAFATRVDFATGAQPQGVEVRDMDGDGKPDLLVVNSGDGTVSILRNTGVMGSLTTNSFASKVDFATGGGCQSVAAGDLDGDGKPDVVTVNSGDGTVSLLRNISTPGSITTNSFAGAVNIAVLSDPVQVAIGDLDGDGKPDLTVTFYLPQTVVSVFRNTSTVGSLTTNSFAPRIDFPLGGRGHTPAIADLDGDGKPDLAVVTEISSLLSIFRNVSTPGSFTNSSFAGRVDFSTGYNAWGVAMGDLDGDGRPDIVFCNAYDNTISIYQNEVPFGGPPVIITQPVDQTETVGGAATFSVTASGTPPLNYQWSFNGTNLVGATNAWLTLFNVQFNQAGDYSVLVTNLYGFILSSNAMLTVNPMPPCDPPPSGLVAWWPGEDNANDIVGGNNGTLVGGASFAAGEVGQAFIFTTTNACITVPASGSLNVETNGGVTLEAWIYPTALTNTAQWLMGWIAGPSSPGVVLKLSQPPGAGQGTGCLFASMVDVSGSNHYLSSAAGILQNNVFQHVALTYDQGSGVATIYCNGVIVAQQNLGSFTARTSYPFVMGAAQSVPPEHAYSGLLDEAAVYNRALTSNEIAAIYNAGSAGKCFTPAPPTITTQPTDQTVTVGSTTTFSVTASGTPPLSYQWNFNGTNILDATNTSLTLTDVQLNQAGNYAVLVTNLYGSILSSNAVLTVNPPPVSIVPVIFAFSPISGIAGTSVTISGTNFSPVTASNIVYFGAVQASVTAASATNLVVTVPVGPTYAPITETVNGLTAYANKPFMPTFFGNGSGINTSNFASRLNLASGSGPIIAAIADLDGDGKPDLVVADVYGNTISLYRNISTNGSLTTGSFATRVDLATPPGSTSPGRLAVADVDGDGKLDIIVSDYDSALVSVYRNTCTPGNISTNTFATRVDFATDAQPQDIAVRDLDGDGRPDILVACSGNGTVSILRNTGVMGSLTTNSFAPKVDIATGSGCDGVAAGDLDGDGKPDVVTANNGAGTVSLLRNISTPGSITTNSFAAKVDITVLSGAMQVAIGDLDGDGKPDLTVTFYLPQTVSVLRNTSTVGSLTTNSFAPRIDFPLGGRGHTPAIADLDGDGKPDLAVVTEISSLLSIFRNVSTPGSFTNSSFAGRVDFSTGNNAWGVAIGDLDGDGRPDIVFCNAYDNTISIYQNEVPFGGPPSITSQPTNQTVVVGSTATFSVTASGTPPLNYQWSFDGTNIVGATNTTLTLTNVQLNQAGNYAVLVTNLYGSILSSNAMLTVIPPPPCDPPPSGLVAWWQAEGNANDSVGTNNGILENGTGFSSGEVGNAFNLDGVNNYVLINASSSLNVGVGSGFTIEGWINPVSVANPLPIAEYERVLGSSSGSDVGAQFYVSSPSAGNLYANVKDASGGDHTITTTAGLVSAGVWQHVALSYDKASGMSAIYLNGAAVTQTNLGSFTAQTSYYLLLGARTTFGSATSPRNAFQGKLDEMSFYNRALTASEIQAIYSAGGSGKCPLLPPSITSQPTNQTVTMGGTANFSVTASGTPPLNYQWNFNGTNIVGATNTILTLTNVQFNQAGNYAVLVTNLYGSILSSNALLTVTLDHFTWSPILSPRFVNTPFAVSIQARDMANGLFTNFTGTAILSSTNGVAVTPPVSGNFVQGVWTGPVVIAQPASNLELRADDGLGHFGLANSINVLSLPGLEMLHSGNIALFMWPVSYSGFMLETSGSLSPAAWVMVPYSPIQIGDQYLLPLDMSGTNGFYRLWFPGP